MILVTVSPEHRYPEKDGLILRVIKTDTSAPSVSQEAEDIEISWDEARRLLVNLASFLTGRHATLDGLLEDVERPV